MISYAVSDSIEHINWNLIFCLREYAGFQKRVYDVLHFENPHPILSRVVAIPVVITLRVLEGVGSVLSVVESLALVIFNTLAVPFYLIKRDRKVFQSIRVTLLNVEKLIHSVVTTCLFAIKEPFYLIAQLFLALHDPQKVRQPNQIYQEYCYSVKCELVTPRLFENALKYLYKKNEEIASSSTPLRFLVYPLSPLTATADALLEILIVTANTIESIVRGIFHFIWLIFERAQGKEVQDLKRVHLACALIYHGLDSVDKLITRVFLFCVTCFAQTIAICFNPRTVSSEDGLYFAQPGDKAFFVQEQGGENIKKYGRYLLEIHELRYDKSVAERMGPNQLYTGTWAPLWPPSSVIPELLNIDCEAN